MDSEVNNFLRQLEEENGGKVTFRTYALYLGFSGEGVKNLGGLFYMVDDRVIFEDFEKEGGLLGLLVKRKSNYEKTKFSFPAGDIDNIFTVKRSSAVKSVQGRIEPSRIQPASGFAKIIRRSVTQILLEDGRAYYFELLDEKAFKDFINK